MCVTEYKIMIIYACGNRFAISSVHVNSSNDAGDVFPLGPVQYYVLGFNGILG